MFTNPRFSQLQVDFNFLFSQLPSFDGEEIDGTRVNYEGLLFPRPHGINMPRSLHPVSRPVTTASRGRENK